jgi:hypothetical protein
VVSTGVGKEYYIKGRKFMNMLEWAKREIEIACKHEREGNETAEGEFDYGCACYESALKAFESLCEDEHSGMSIHITQEILNRLIDHKCLTPIEDIPEVWSATGESEEFIKEHGYNSQQCNRMSSLFKHTYVDSHIEYVDVDQSVCIDEEHGYGYHSWLIKDKAAEKYPEVFKIKMPYCPPSKRIKIYAEDFVTDRKNGDYDTVAIFYLVTPNGEKLEINRFFKSDGGEEWIELTAEEYQARKLLKLGE